MKKEETSDFYDEYIQRQLKSGANRRLLTLYRRLQKLGLQRNSNVLELGCGVGIFTKLLSRTVSTGTIEAVDLSAQSVKVAQQNLSHRKNIRFQVADIVSCKPETNQFDFITLMDVIEHIPLDRHEALFSNLAALSSLNTQIVINIPNPEYLAYAKIHHPETLQLLEEEVRLLPLLERCESVGLEMLTFEKYGIWEEEDYHFMVLRKKQQFSLRHKTAKSLSEKFSNKIAETMAAYRYR